MAKIGAETIDIKTTLIIAGAIVSVTAGLTVTSVMASRTASELSKLETRVTTLERVEQWRQGYEAGQAVRGVPE